MNKINTVTNLLIGIKNGYSIKNKYAYCKIDNFNLNLLWILYKENLVAEYKINDDLNKIEIKLKYINNKPLLSEIELISSPSLKKFVNINTSKLYYKKFDYFFFSTSTGILTSQVILKNFKIGGQLLFGLKICK